MKGYVAYGQKVGLKVVEHRDISAVEFGFGDCVVWHDLSIVANSFRKKDIDDIKAMLTLKYFKNSFDSM